MTRDDISLLRTHKPKQLPAAATPAVASTPVHLPSRDFAQQAVVVMAKLSGSYRRAKMALDAYFTSDRDE